MKCDDSPLLYRTTRNQDKILIRHGYSDDIQKISRGFSYRMSLYLRTK